MQDRQEQESDPLEINKICLLYSDVNFLIFTNKGKRYGVIRELAFVAEDEQMRMKVDHCVVLMK